MYCSKCGQELKDGVCPNCGYKNSPETLAELWTAMKKLVCGKIANVRADGGLVKTKWEKLMQIFRQKRWVLVAGASFMMTIVVILALLLSNRNVYEDALLKKVDSERINAENITLSYQYTNAILDSVNYHILKKDASKNCAEVTFTYVDVLKLAEIYSEDTSADEFYQHCIDSIKTGNAPTLEKTITVFFAKQRKNWKTELNVIDSVELADVMSGGVATEYYKLTGSGNR